MHLGTQDRPHLLGLTAPLAAAMGIRGSQYPFHLFPTWAVSALAKLVQVRTQGHQRRADNRFRHIQEPQGIRLQRI